MWTLHRPFNLILSLSIYLFLSSSVAYVEQPNDDDNEVDDDDDDDDGDDDDDDDYALTMPPKTISLVFFPAAFCVQPPPMLANLLFSLIFRL